jgi:hypothetical protein
MKETTIQFWWSDAWLLLAIGLAADTHSVASLASVIELADGIQHAIPSKDEMDGALGRLQRAGYVRHTREGVELLESGRLLVKRSNRVFRGLIDRQHALEKALHATPWSAAYHPQSARGGEHAQVADDQWEQLMTPYHR